MKKLKTKLVILLIMLTGCDFTSGLHKDILRAQGYITKQNFKEAVEIYEDILERKPSKTIQIKINFQLGEIYSLYLNDYEKALSHLETIIDSSNEPLWQVKALERIGSIQFEKFKNYKVAKKAYKNLMDFVPKLERQESYTFRYAQCAFHMENYKESSRLFKELSVSNDEEVRADAYYYLGLTHFYLSEWDTAVNYWFEFLKREKRKDKIVQVKFLIANAYESAEKLKEAYNIYYSIIGEYPNPDVIEKRLNSLYERRVARKR
ncbi:MAG: hypothetical protein WD025_02800 [Bacteriovoracaceae bacterium]